MKRLEHMKECLMATVENQMTHLEQVDTKELGEAVDMIKDLAEAIYYCTITEAMHSKEKEGNGHQEEKMYYSGGYQQPMYYGGGYPYPMYYGGGQMNDVNGSQMQYSESGRGSANQYGGSNGNRQYSEGGGGSSSNGGGSSSGGGRQYSEMMRDEREGKSPRSRRMYMESKEQHHDKAAQMKELENYMQELTSDIVEMVEGSTQEEKQYLSKRVAALANKLAQLND